MWTEKSWLLHQDNVTAYSAFSVRIVLEHPPYSPDLAPGDFYLFPKIKSDLKGTIFDSKDAIK